MNWSFRLRDAFVFSTIVKIYIANQTVSTQHALEATVAALTAEAILHEKFSASTDADPAYLAFQVIQWPKKAIRPAASLLSCTEQTRFRATASHFVS